MQTTQLYCTSNIEQLEGMVNLLNEEITALVRISKNHSLSINPNKSSVIVFGSDKDRQRAINGISLFVSGQKLEYKETIKCLGLNIDVHFRFVSHVNSLIRKSHCLLKSFYANRHCLNEKSKIMLCDSIILSMFNYCDVVYGPCLDLKISSRIQQIQNACVRFIFGLKRRDHVTRYLSEIGWLKMHNRRYVHMACFVHNLINIQYPEYLFSKLVPRYNVHQRELRNSEQFTIPRHSTAMFQRSFSYQAVTIYNSLSNNIKNLSKLNFKKSIKKLTLADQ